ncbi:MAG TPA: sigma-70 family RNA polymerase sigma factor [Frankiaceae bacterium]|jgi:RNA polymerase sigma-70 factor (ECF subfamily)|nr:sigma-70 family RNA polymerase sigma factor [Frankiaceae bacterium]
MDTDPRIAFCRREHPRLVGALSLYTGDADLAEELAQEALARACRSWRRVESYDAPGAWVHRVGINLANSHFRRKACERRARERVGAAPATYTEPDAADAVAVRAAVASLPRRQRTALVLRYYADLPVAEVAAQMQCREGTVRALTAQAIAGLRERLDLTETEALDVP